MRSILLMGALLLFAGCNPGDARELTEDTKKLAGTAGKAAGNASVAARVNTVLSLRKGVDMSGLHIEAEGGTVTVGGHVRNAEEKARVLETVDGIRGVEKVIDKLRVATN